MILKMSEMELVRWTISYICLKGHYAWRNNAGKLPMTDKYGKKRFINLGEKGLPDIIGYTNTGKFIGIEVKIKPNKPSPIQLEQLDRMQASGCIARVIYTQEDAEALPL